MAVWCVMSLWKSVLPSERERLCVNTSNEDEDGLESRPGQTIRHYDYDLPEWFDIIWLICHSQHSSTCSKGPRKMSDTIMEININKFYGFCFFLYRGPAWLTDWRRHRLSDSSKCSWRSQWAVNGPNVPLPDSRELQQF